MTPFKIKRADGRAQWQVIFDAIHDDPYGKQYSYDAFGILLETRDRHAIQQTVMRCNRELWKRAQRSLSNVREIGYRLLQPTEHEMQALDYQERGRRKIKSAVSVMRATNLEMLNDAERNRVLNIEAVLVAMGRAIDFHGQRLTKHDEILRSLTERVEILERTRE